jgi:hypothetical protein
MNPLHSNVLVDSEREVLQLRPVLELQDIWLRIPVLTTETRSLKKVLI